MAWGLALDAKDSATGHIVGSLGSRSAGDAAAFLKGTTHPTVCRCPPTGCPSAGRPGTSFSSHSCFCCVSIIAAAAASCGEGQRCGPHSPEVTP